MILNIVRSLEEEVLSGCEACVRKYVSIGPLA